MRHLGDTFRGSRNRAEMPALWRGGTDILEAEGEKIEYIDGKNGGRVSCCFCFYGLKRSLCGNNYAINGKFW